MRCDVSETRIPPASRRSDRARSLSRCRRLHRRALWKDALRVVITGLAFASTLSVSTLRSVRAEERNVEQLIDRGLELRTNRRDLEALEVFQAAYDISLSPRALAQVALAEQALGRWVEAELHLKAAIERRDDAWIETHLRVLEGALSVIGRRLGSIEIMGNVPGAEIRINGQVAGHLPFGEPLRVPAGSAVIDVACDGYWPVSQTVIVPAGGLARETIRLVEKKADSGAPGAEVDPLAAQLTRERTAIAPDPRPAASPDGASLAVDEARAQRVELSPPHGSESEGDTMTTWGYAAAGGAAAGLALGLVELVLRNRHFTNYNNDDVCLAGNRTRRENCGAEKEAGRTAEAWSAVGFASGGSLAVISAVLFFLGSAGSESGAVGASPSGGRAALLCGFGGVAPGAPLIGASCGGRFE